MDGVPVVPIAELVDRALLAGDSRAVAREVMPIVVDRVVEAHAGGCRFHWCGGQTCLQLAQVGTRGDLLVTDEHVQAGPLAIFLPVTVPQDGDAVSAIRHL